MANKESLVMDGKMIKVKLVRPTNLYVFDFDDTIAETEETVLVRTKKSNRVVDHLSSQQEADEHILKTNHYYDYSEFVNVENAKEIELVTDYLRKLASENQSIIVLSARQPEASRAVRQYLKSIGVNTEYVKVACVNGSANKYKYLKKAIRNINPKEKVTVFEDTLKNIQMMLPLEKDYPNLSFDFIHLHKPQTDEELEEANRNRYHHMNSSSAYGTEKYQRTLKRIHPAMKRRLISLGRNSYSVGRTKKVKDFKRSKSAPPSG